MSCSETIEQLAERIAADFVGDGQAFTESRHAAGYIHGWLEDQGYHEVNGRLVPLGEKEATALETNVLRQGSDENARCPLCGELGLHLCKPTPGISIGTQPPAEPVVTDADREVVNEWFRMLHEAGTTNRDLAAIIASFRHDERQRWEARLSNEKNTVQHQTQAKEYEKARRIYYQDIVYAVCNELDRIYGGHCVCGTIEEPSTEVQALMKSLNRGNRVSQVERDLARVNREFDDYLKSLAEAVGCDMEEYALPSAHGNDRLRWASLIATKMVFPKERDALQKRLDAVDKELQHVEDSMSYDLEVVKLARRRISGEQPTTAASAERTEG